MRYLTNATSTIQSNTANAFSFATTTTGIPLLRLSTLTDNESLTLGGDLIIGTVGKGKNLIFEENSTISGQGANTLTFGTAGDKINFAVNTGIGSTTPYSTLSVSGTTGQAQPLFTLASSSNQKYLEVSATGTLSILSGATTTSANGFALTTGCFAVSGVCVTGGAFTSSGGYTYLNTDTDEVGIGTSTPQAKFTIEGDSGQTNHLFAVASSTIISSSSATSSQTRSSSQGYYATIDALGKTTLTGKVLNPTHVGAITDSAATELQDAYSIFVSGSYAYVASQLDAGVEILDISNPANPVHVGSITDNAITELNGAHFIFVSGSYAYVVGNWDDGVEILDISNPANPTHVGAITDDGTTALNGANSI